MAAPFSLWGPLPQFPYALLGRGGVYCATKVKAMPGLGAKSWIANRRSTGLDILKRRANRRGSTDADDGE